MIRKKQRSKAYRILAMMAGYYYRLPVFTVPAPLYALSDVPTGAPDDDLIGAIAPDNIGDDYDDAMAVYA